MGEFDLIQRFFKPLERGRADVRLGIGDDAALLLPEPGAELVATTDSLIEGRHFLAGAAPHSLGHRALAVNLSDLAAMGARPRWALLALTLPQVDEQWLAQFARGFAALAHRHDVALVGGNTGRGPLNITVQLLGSVPGGTALLRSGAAVGDAVYVSGTPGDAAAGREAHSALRERFEFPEPRVALGMALRGIASACIDVSDGLAADLGKLAAASGVGAQLQIEQLPLSAALRAAAGEDAALHCALAGGEDYELCFTVPPARAGLLAALQGARLCRITQIGILVAGSGVAIRQGDRLLDLDLQGFDHFPI